LDYKRERKLVKVLGSMVGKRKQGNSGREQKQRNLKLPYVNSSEQFRWGGVSVFVQEERKPRAELPGGLVKAGGKKEFAYQATGLRGRS